MSVLVCVWVCVCECSSIDFTLRYITLTLREIALMHIYLYISENQSPNNYSQLWNYLDSLYFSTHNGMFMKLLCKINRYTFLLQIGFVSVRHWLCECMCMCMWRVSLKIHFPFVNTITCGNIHQSQHRFYHWSTSYMNLIQF